MRTRFKYAATVIVTTLVVGAGACAAISDNYKNARGLGDAPLGKLDGSKKEAIEFPNGFSNVAHACDGHGHRVYVVNHGGKSAAAPTVITDESCSKE